MKTSKLLSVLLAVVMLLTVIPLGAVSVSAAAINLSTFNSRLAEFKKSVYPEGSTYQDNPSAYGGYECFGFANQIAKYMFGSYPTKSGSAIDTINTNWKVTYGGAAVDSLVIGDIVRFNYGGYDHSIFVTSISGDNIYYCQANVPANTNKVTYSNKMARSTLKNYVKKALNGNSAKTGWVAHYKSSVLGSTATPELTIKYDVNGGTIASNIVSYKYKVTESVGVNMRKNAGTGYDVLTVLPNNTTFTVKVGDTKTANGYTWGKTTYDGKTGWVVISDFVSKTATNRDTTYYVSSAMVYKSSTGKVHTQVMVHGTSYPDGVYNAATFGLTRSGYSFVGWSTKADGSATIFNQNTALKAEQIYPNIKNGSATITLYAIWECNHTYDNACDTSCNVCGANREVDDHAFVATVTTAATCGAVGVMTYTCSDCGDFYIESIPATDDHTYDHDYDPDCNACGAVRAVPDKPVDVVPGDADGSGSVNVRDVALLQQYLAGWDATLVAASADADGDGSVTVRDVALLQQYLAGWDVELK